MIYAIMLLFAATVGALIGIFCVTATASGEKYDGELYEHDRKILMRRINRLERMIKAQDAISAARALIGTPYSELDCINLIKRVIRTAPGGVEITEGEYTRLLAEIREKAALVDRLYSGEIILADVSADWREEIQRRVDKCIAVEDAAEDQDISAEETLNLSSEMVAYDTKMKKE